MQLGQSCLELPLFFDLLMIISLLFSTYKLYLVFKEMLGFSQDDGTAEEDDAENGQSPMSGNRLNSGFRKIKKSFERSKCIKGVSYSIDFTIIVCVVIKFVSVYEGAEMSYEDDRVSMLLYHLFYVPTIIQQCIQLLAFIMSIFILFGIRNVLNKRPICQTGLCGDLLFAEAEGRTP